jgi:hypothetical protein
LCRVQGNSVGFAADLPALLQFVTNIKLAGKDILI